jgi:maltoporin
MEKMQRQYEQRISAMEAQMKSLESKADSGTILNTRILTDSDGKGGPPAPVLTEDFIKSLTRNFVFAMYVRAGFSFNGNGGSGDFSFVIPDNIGGRFRLGNENDFYMEPTWIQNHILGDGPDVADVTFRFTPNLYDNIAKFSFLTSGSNPSGTSGNGFNIGIREAFAEMKNVFRGAPEITFWGGQRFYDRYNIDPDDLFWLDSSGFGVGAYNIDLGFGKLYLAWLGGYRDTLNLINNGVGAAGLSSQVGTVPTNSIGNLFQHTFDVRIKEIPFLCGKLALVGIGTYMKGNTVSRVNTSLKDSLGNPFIGTLETGDSWGGGGGAIWEYDWGNKSYFRLFALASKGNLNFGGTTDPSFIESNMVNDFTNGVARLRNGRSATGITQINGATVPITSPLANFTAQLSPQNRTFDVRVGYEFVWNVTPCFSFDTWAYWDNSNFGYTTFVKPHRAPGTGPGDLVDGGGSRNLVGVGVRPVVWICDNFAIQGQAGYNYIDNNRGAGNNISCVGRGGSMGIFTIAPTIKPTGGYFTRPEIRIFATYAIWNHSLAQGAVINTGAPPYINNQNQGWLFGSQMEIWF